MSVFTPIYRSADCIRKLPRPILTSADVPYDASLVFNAGVAKINGKYIMIFRNDYGASEGEFFRKEKKFRTSLGLAVSDNGVDGWRVMPKPIFDSATLTGETKRLYDPRLTVIEGKAYLCLAMDTHHGTRGCVAALNEHMDGVEILSASAPDNRNMVLFPERIGGKYVRLERPFPVYSRHRQDRFDIWVSCSPDLRFWGETELLLGVEDVPFANDKIGPAAPPIKTEKGWLTTFHAVDIAQGRGKNGWEAEWGKRYTAGIMLLDLENPQKVIGISREPLIAPELPFETDEGFRQKVIFPGGMIAEPDGEVKIYYGASDTVECLATAHIDELLALCLPC